MVIILFLFLIPCGIDAFELSAETLTEIFGSKICIPGSLSSIQFTSPDPLFMKNNVITEEVLNITKPRIDASNSVTRLNELAQYNGLKYFYKLEKEEGPAHDKTFTLSLTLGDELYEGHGKSLKAAKQNVAGIALVNTHYEVPPVKERNQNTGSETPMALLNNLSSKLGIPVEYELVDKERQVLSDTGSTENVKTKKSYFQKLNDSLDSSGLHMKKDLPQEHGPFQIKLKVLDKYFYGFAHSIKAAKHDAASKALDYLIQNKDNLDTPCQKEGMEEQCKQAKQRLKSPISQIYEEAQLRKISVDFEIIDEHGPAHKKTFVTQCTLGDLSTNGEGHSKKESKRNAAEAMLQRLSELTPLPQETYVNQMMKDKKSKKKKKKKNNKIIKTKFDEIKMMAENLMDSITGNEVEKKDDVSHDNMNRPKQKPNQPGNKKHSYQGEMLELSNSLNFEVKFTDFSEKDRHHSVLSLGINPEYICYGNGLDKKAARDSAALGGLKVLFKLGLYDNSQSPIYTELERDIKANVEVLLREEPKQEKDEL